MWRTVRAELLRDVDEFGRVLELPQGYARSMQRFGAGGETRIRPEFRRALTSNKHRARCGYLLEFSVEFLPGWCCVGCAHEGLRQPCREQAPDLKPKCVKAANRRIVRLLPRGIRWTGGDNY